MNSSDQQHPSPLPEQPTMEQLKIRLALLEQTNDMLRTKVFKLKAKLETSRNSLDGFNKRFAAYTQDTSVKELSKYYTDFTNIDKDLVLKRDDTGKVGRATFGIDWEELSELLPRFKSIVAKEHAKQTRRQDAKVRRQVRKQKNSKLKKVADNHLAQTAHDMTSHLGLFYGFIRRCEGKDTELTYSMLFCLVRLEAYVYFCSESYAPSTVRARTTMMAKVLKWYLTQEDSEGIRGKICAAKDYLLEVAQDAKMDVKRLAPRILGEEVMTNAGHFATDKEHVALQLWNLNLWKQSLQAFTCATTDAIKRKLAQTLQRCLMLMLMHFCEGLRREVVAGILWKLISYEDGHDDGTNVERTPSLAVKVGREKRLRSKSDQIPLPAIFRSYLDVFLQTVRPSLLVNHPTKPKLFNPMSLWVSKSGSAMEYPQFTKQIKAQISKFNKKLNITPIQFRRMVITKVFAGRVNFGELSFEQTLSKLAELLNVTPRVMEQHYSHFVGFENTVRTQERLGETTRTPEVEEKLRQVDAVNRSVTPTSALPKVRRGITRLVRETEDDVEWEKIEKEYEEQERERKRRRTIPGLNCIFVKAKQK